MEKEKYNRENYVNYDKKYVTFNYNQGVPALNCT